MKILIPVLVLLTLVRPAWSEMTTYRATAPSDITVQFKSGIWIVHQKSVRYEVYPAIPEDIKGGVPFSPRLARITTVSDGEIDNQTNRIEVTVDALSGPAPRRIAGFSDAGSEGVVSPPYFITTQTGCCSPLVRHHVRDIETGKLLFTATGSGEAGLVTLMNVPNHHSMIARWAAYEGRPGDPALLGYLRYGDRHGAIDTIALGMNAADQPQNFSVDLAECGALLWVEPGRSPASGEPKRPSGETCFTPRSLSYSQGLFSLEHKSGGLGGFELEFSLGGEVYATIPVEDDRLDVTHARLARGMSLMQVPPSP